MGSRPVSPRNALTRYRARKVNAPPLAIYLLSDHHDGANRCDGCTQLLQIIGLHRSESNPFKSGRGPFDLSQEGRGQLLADSG